jgi:hypothetical protein
MSVCAYSNVVNPDEVNVVQGDGVSTPDVLGVDVGDCDVPGRGKCELVGHCLYIPQE